MDPKPVSAMNQERHGSTLSGWPMLPISIGLLALGIYLVVHSATLLHQGRSGGLLLLLAILLIVLSLISWGGFFTLQPNEARVLILFGAYRCTIRHSGFHWTNPFYTKKKISLRMRNLNGERLKVNDKRGNPIEIAAVVVWKVDDTAQAVFDVDDYENYVQIQSESAVRHLASGYAYDQGEEEEIALRKIG